MVSSVFRVLSSTAFLASIVFTIPLAFDIGGRDCGLAFSLSLATFYFFYSTLRLATPPESRIRKSLVLFIASIQWLVIPTLLIWSLNQFSIDASNSGSSSGSWVERTFSKGNPGGSRVQAVLFGEHGFLQAVTIRTWDRALRWSIPFFQVAEGFCSLLVIQAAGQITKWAVNRENGDNWMIGLLVLSASIIANSVYFLYRMTRFELDNFDAILIGATITSAVFLSAAGVGSGRGNPVESSLLFAYITLCIYQIFTDYRPTGGAGPPAPATEADFPPLPPIIMASYSTLLHLLSSFPSAIKSAFHFMTAAVMTITPSVIISLAYRVFVFYASTRIVPAVRESGARALSQEPSLDDSDGVGQILGLVSWYSPSILIAVYTSLLMQHFANAGWNGGSGEWITAGIANGSSLVRWINLGLTMLLYAVELYLGKGHNDGLTSHWKVD